MQGYSSMSYPFAKFSSLIVVSVINGTIGLTPNNSSIEACSIFLLSFGSTSSR